MPMIDVLAIAGTFRHRQGLAGNLSAAVMRWEKGSDLNLSRNNTASFIHEPPPAAIADVIGDGDSYVFRALTPAGVLDRQKQLGAVKGLTDDLVTKAADDPGFAS
jgi:hypothetical protein